MFLNRLLTLNLAYHPDLIRIIFGLKAAGYGVIPVILISQKKDIGLNQIVRVATEEGNGENTTAAIVGRKADDKKVFS